METNIKTLLFQVVEKMREKNVFNVGSIIKIKADMLALPTNEQEKFLENKLQELQ